MSRDTFPMSEAEQAIHKATGSPESDPLSQLLTSSLCAAYYEYELDESITASF